MKNFKSILFLMLLMVINTLGVFAQNDNKFNQVNFTEVSQLEVSTGQGVSAPFSGVVGDKIVVIGGCNFPDVPAAEGGSKQYYGNIYTYDGNTWQLNTLAFDAVAYGVSVQVPEGIVCIGGMGQSGVFRYLRQPPSQL